MSLTLTGAGQGSEVTGPAVYNNAVDVDSPAGHYKLGEPSGTTLVARVGPNGTYTGTPTLGVTGIVIKNGSDTCVSFPRPAGTVGAYAGVAQAAAEAAFDGGPNITHECWVTPLSDVARSSTQNLIDRTFYGLYLSADNKPGIFYGVAGASTQTAVAALTVAGGPYHLVYTWDGTTHVVYVNAVSVISVAGALTAGGPLGVATYPGGSDTANVTMDEVAIYKTALSAARVSAHRAAGS